MKHTALLLIALIAFTSCKKDNEDTLTDGNDEPAILSFDTKKYEKKSELYCREDNCTHVNISVPEAVGMGKISDNINDEVFDVVREIVYFGEKPTNANTYEEIVTSFIKSYEELSKEFPEDSIPWEADIKAAVAYRTDSIINIGMENYMFTGGAHGYSGRRSLLFSAKTGEVLDNKRIFNDKNGFTDLAEKKFRQKYNIPEQANINSTGLFFLEDKFELPENIFFEEGGVRLYYNSDEVGSHAEGAKDILMPYSEAKQYIRIKH